MTTPPDTVKVPRDIDWLLVPREPSINMLHELFAEPLPQFGPARLAVAVDRYKAMLAKIPLMAEEDPEAIMDALAAAASPSHVPREATTALKPCPFCGGEPLIYPLGERQLAGCADALVECQSCLAEVTAPNDEAVFAAWNARAAAPPQPEPGWQPSALERTALKAVLHLAAEAYQALDNAEQRPEDGQLSLIIFHPWTKRLQDALDALDDLPDDQPGYTMSPNAKVAWALRRLLPAPPKETKT